MRFWSCSWAKPYQLSMRPSESPDGAEVKETVLRAHFPPDAPLHAESEVQLELRPRAPQANARFVHGLVRLLGVVVRPSRRIAAVVPSAAVPLHVDPIGAARRDMLG